MRIVLLAFLFFTSSFSSICSIHCRFFIDEITLNEINEKKVTTQKSVQVEEQQLNETFNCEQDTKIKPENHDVFFDDYEEVTECLSTPKPYFPNTMNNIYNEVRKIYQVPTFVQTVFANECLEKGKLCTGGRKGCTCTQRFTTITLVIEDDDQDIVKRESFYVPVACTCDPPPIPKED